MLMAEVKEAKKRVLIIDDEPQIGKIFGLKLSKVGFDVTCTTSGAEGIDLIHDTKPDVVLLDILMPGVSGFDVLEKVRKFSDIPIIVFTARPETIKMASELGANDYIIKPANPDMLVEKLTTTLKQPPLDRREIDF